MKQKQHRAIRVSMIAKTRVDEEKCSFLREKNPLGAPVDRLAARPCDTLLDSPRRVLSANITSGTDFDRHRRPVSTHCRDVSMHLATHACARHGAATHRTIADTEHDAVVALVSG
jgi:hypothetical protein